MGLGKLDKPKELWSNVISKEGKEYPNIQRCNDIAALETEDPALDKVLTDKYNEWVASVGAEAAEEKLHDWKGKDGGYQYPHNDGWVYKFTRGSNGNLQLSRMKPFEKGGFRKGGSFTFMRTSQFKVATVDSVATIINNQGTTDNWKITYMREGQKGSEFMMENMQPFTPASTTAAKDEKADKEETDQDE